MRVIAIVLLVALGTPARAQSTGDDALLAAAERKYADLDYRAAAELAERVGTDEQATRGQQARAWERVGLSWLVLGQKALAKEALDRLFAIDADRQVEDPSLSPRQKQFIDDERAAVKDAKPKPAPVEVKPVEPKPAPVVVVVKKPVYKRWWVWTTVGLVVAAGVGVGVGLGLGLSSGPPKGGLGTVGLGLRW